MTDHPDDRITYFGRTDHRNAGVVFGIKQIDRFSHFYVTGKTGTGKTHLLRTMLLQDIAAGQGLALFDPHGDLVTKIRDLVPAARRADVIYIDPSDPLLTWRFNPVEAVQAADRPLATAGLVEAFKKLWPDDWGPRLEHLLRNVIFTLLEIPNSTLADVPPLLSDKSYRNSILPTIDNEVVRTFWHEEYDRYSPGFRAVVIAPLQNKLGALLTDPNLRRILTEPGLQLDLRRVMDEGRVLLVNLDKGRIGEGPAAALGSFLLSHIALTGLSRSRQEPAARNDFLLYLDEFQTFTTLSIANMLSELRKYRIGLVLAHQHLSQLEPAIRDAVFGNVGTIVAFRVGAADSSYLAHEFASVFSATDLISLPRFSVLVKLHIDGATSRPFSGTSLSLYPR